LWARVGALLLLLGVIANRFRDSAKTVSRKGDEDTCKHSTIFLLRPSTLLLILSVGSFSYWWMHDQSPLAFLFWPSVFAILAACKLRRHEDESEE